jgi:type I site-specific restriction endonuclease
VVVVRDEEWIVSACEPAGDGWKISCVGSSELVASVPATFFTELDEITSLDAADAELVADDSPYFRRSRLWVEAVLRKTPVPLHDQRLTVSPHMLLDRLDFQRRAVAQALDPARLRPRLLIADAVGLGKTLEIGMILAELARRGRAQRVLVVTPRHVLEQMQHELWTRFALPLVRLDSDGIQSVRQQLPASRNPFTYYPKVIVSIDTLKSARYWAHLERHRWDAVVIDESHNVTNSATQLQAGQHPGAQHGGVDPGVGDPAQRQEGQGRRVGRPQLAIMLGWSGPEMVRSASRKGPDQGR